MRVLAACVAGGLALGLLAHLADSGPGPARDLMSALGPFVVAGTLAGRLTRPVPAAGAGICVLLCGVLAYYAPRDPAVALVVAWCVAAVGAGAVLGPAGRAMRRPARVLPAVPVGLLAGEALFLLFARESPDRWAPIAFDLAAAAVMALAARTRTAVLLAAVVLGTAAPFVLSLVLRGVAP